MPRSKNPSLKDEELYEDLREQGNSTEETARISNAATARGRSAVERRRPVRFLPGLHSARLEEASQAARAHRLATKVP